MLLLCLQCFLTNKRTKNFAWWFFFLLSFFWDRGHIKFFNLIKMISMHRGAFNAAAKSVFYSNSIFGRTTEAAAAAKLNSQDFISFEQVFVLLWDYEIILSAPYSEFNDYSIYFTLLFQFFAVLLLLPLQNRRCHTVGKKVAVFL